MKLSQFTKQMNESVGRKCASVVYAQFNPITPQELSLVESARDWARTNNVDLYVFSPELKSHRKSPLKFDEKANFIKQNLGFSLTKSNSLTDAIDFLHENDYVKANLFLPEEMHFSAKSLVENTNYGIAKTDIFNNEETRKSIIEHVLKRIYIGEDFENHEMYFNSLISNCMVNLKEANFSVESRQKFEPDMLLSNVTNGDIIKVISFKDRVFGESIIHGTPEWYDQDDLVVVENLSNSPKPPTFSDIVGAINEFHFSNKDK